MVFLRINFLGVSRVNQDTEILILESINNERDNAWD